MTNKGQISWVWAVFVAIVGLILSAWLWIILDQGQNSFADKALEIGTNSEHMTILNSIWGVSPFFIIVGFIIFVWIIAAQTKRGDVYA